MNFDDDVEGSDQARSRAVRAWRIAFVIRGRIVVRGIIRVGKAGGPPTSGNPDTLKRVSAKKPVTYVTVQ